MATTRRKLHPRTKFNDKSAGTYVRAIENEANFMTPFDRARFLNHLISALQRMKDNPAAKAGQ